MEIAIEVHRKGDIGLNVASPPYAPNQDGYRWNEMVLWVHETTLATKSEAVTC